MQFAKYISVVLASMLKFIGGPLSGVAFGLPWLQTYLLTVLGMMISVFLFMFLGQTLKSTILRRFYKNRLLFTPRNRRLVRVWRRYGLAGVAFLTPILLTPIGGTVVAASFGEPKVKIFIYMLVSALFWGCLLTLVIEKLGDKASGLF